MNYFVVEYKVRTPGGNIMVTQVSVYANSRAEAITKAMDQIYTNGEEFIAIARVY
jgi:hypothetical protein